MLAKDESFTQTSLMSTSTSSPATLQRLRIFDRLPLQMSLFAHLSARSKLQGLRWIVFLTVLLVVLFGYRLGHIYDALPALIVVALYSLTNIVFAQRVSRSFEGPGWTSKLLLADLSVIAVALFSLLGLDSNFYLVCALIVYFSVTGKNTQNALPIAILGSLLYSVMLSWHNPSADFLDAQILIHMPFFFLLSLFTGYLSVQEEADRRKIDEMAKRAEKIKETDRLKRQLVSALAHDIKNPLGIIMVYAQTMASWLEAQPEDKKNLEPIQRIQDNAERIVKLVTGFLDASRAETGNIEMVRRPVALNLLIREVGQQQMVESRKKNLSMTVDLADNLPDIMGDQAQLDRVLWNLVGNAIKFTPRGGTIALTSRVDDGHACVSVKDTGMGIPQDELPLLLSEFRRLKGTAQIEGTGLGLFIVKTIVEAHGGKVDVESKVGQGSTFTVRFPINS